MIRSIPFRIEMPKSVMKPTMLAIEITGATWSPPKPTSPRMFDQAPPPSVRRMAMMPPIKARGMLSITRSAALNDPVEI